MRSYSPQASTPSIAKGFRQLFIAWVNKHPEWRLDLNIIGGSGADAAGDVNAQGVLRRHPEGARRGRDDRRSFAGSVLAVLPAILLFLVLQRFIVGAFVQGALKG